MKNSRTQIAKLTDVAQLARVGNATVSRALNGGKNVSGETMRRVSAAIVELNYRPNRVAQSLKGASSGLIGMIVPSLSDLFFSKCAEAVEAVVRANAAVLVVSAAHDDDEIAAESVRHLLLHNIDGLVMACSKPPNRDLIQLLRAARLPVVGIDGPLSAVGRPSVLCENYEGARLATEHLLGHGYAQVISVQVKPNLYTMRERVRGYRDAVLGSGGEPIEEAITDRAGAIDVLCRRIRKRGPAIAVFAGNNLSARYLCEAIHVLGLSIPEQVALLSFDDFDLADTLSPPMSVVQQPVEEIGRRAARLLFEQASKTSAAGRKQSAEMVLLAPRLILRQSCGCNGGAWTTAGAAAWADRKACLTG